MTYLVVCGNYAEWVAWCNKHGFQLIYGQKKATRPGESARFITKEAEADGLVNCKVVVVGSWAKHNPLRNSAWLKARSKYSD